MARARSAARRLAALAALAVIATIVGGASAAHGQTGDTSLGRGTMAAAMRPGQFTYQTTLERDVSTTIIGTRTVTLSQATYAGAPAWLFVEARTGDSAGAGSAPGGATDSLFVDLTGVRPVHWSAAMGGARLAAEFRGDSVFGGVSSPISRRSMVGPVGHGTLINAAMLENRLSLAPLQTAWEDSTATLSVTLGSNAVLPTRMSVIGDDRVRVPAGTFDCWVVAVHTDQSRGLYWVTKTDPIVVRSALDVPLLGGAQLVNSLVRVTR